jgi:type II secretory ATPase GspE/PulE/Tfp pilus assembly ATPase PilB-like protein
MNALKEKIKEQLALSGDTRIIRIIDKIFNFAIGCEAEEIYFEPRAQDLAVIFQAAGEVKNTLVLPKRVEEAVLGGVKAMAGLNYPSANLAPAGKFKKSFAGYKIIFSLAVRPSRSGEKVIVNLHKEKFDLLGLGQLGFSGQNLKRIKKVLDSRRGLVAVIGDLNSGQTSTLYSFISYLKRPDLNIATVEQEIARHLPQVNQSLINPRVGFGSGAATNALRRQDVDVVMISEINDRETAEAALQLAAAGHFVLTGILSQDVVSSLNFLNDLAVPLSSLAANTKLAVTQRLVDKNCPFCLKPQKISHNSWRRLDEKLFLSKLLPRLKRDKIISAKISRPEDFIFYQSSGCPRCQDRGVAGRIGIFEILEITPEVKALIKSGHFSSVREEVKKQGGYSLAEDAFIKALGGLISLEEVLKVIG